MIRDIPTRQVQLQDLQRRLLGSDRGHQLGGVDGTALERDVGEVCESGRGADQRTERGHVCAREGNTEAGGAGGVERVDVEGWHFDDVSVDGIDARECHDS